MGDERHQATGRAASWKALSSASSVWPYGAPGAEFEVRRAVSALTAGLRFVRVDDDTESNSETAEDAGHDPDAAEMEVLVNLNNAIHRLPRVFELHQIFFREEGMGFDPLVSAYKILDDSCAILRRPASLKALDRLARQHDDDFEPWVDTSTKTYLFDLVCKAHLALTEMVKMIRAENDDYRAFFLHVGSSKYYLGTILNTMTRPECMNVLAKLERQLRGAGEPVFQRPSPERLQGGVSLAEARRAIWRRDKATTAAALGVETIDETLTLEDVRRIVYDTFSDDEKIDPTQPQQRQPPHTT